MIPREILRTEYIDPMNPIPLPVFDKSLSPKDQENRLMRFFKNLVLK